MKSEPQATDPRTLDLAKLGGNHLVYVKPTWEDGRKLFAVHAADGTRIWLTESRDIAFASARQQGLEPAEVH